MLSFLFFFFFYIAGVLFPCLDLCESMVLACNLTFWTIGAESQLPPCSPAVFPSTNCVNITSFLGTYLIYFPFNTPLFYSFYSILFSQQNVVIDHNQQGLSCLQSD